MTGSSSPISSPSTIPCNSQKLGTYILRLTQLRGHNITFLVMPALAPIGILILSRVLVMPLPAPNRSKPPEPPPGRMEGVARARQTAARGPLPFVPWLGSPPKAANLAPVAHSTEKLRLLEEARLGLRAYVRNLAAMDPPTAGPISRLILYGSYARGDAREESDVDVALILAGDAPEGNKAGVRLRTVWSLIDAENDVLQDLLIDISPMAIWESELRDPDSHSNPWFVRNLLAEGIEVTAAL